MLTHRSPGRKHCLYAAVNSGDLLIKHRIKPGTLAHTYNRTAAEAKALPSLRPACDSIIINNNFFFNCYLPCSVGC